MGLDRDELAGRDDQLEVGGADLIKPRAAPPTRDAPEILSDDDCLFEPRIGPTDS